MFPTTIHEVHTTERVKPQQAAKNTVSANRIKWFDITSVADRKSNLLQYHENTSDEWGKNCNHAPGYTGIKKQEEVSVQQLHCRSHTLGSYRYPCL